MGIYWDEDGVIETGDRDARRESDYAEGAAAERDAIVAWLRSTPGERGCPWTDAANEIADALERGAHRDDEKEGENT